MVYYDRQAIITDFRIFAHFVSIDPVKNRRRFYTVLWQPALWEDGALVRSWGRVGAAGRSMATCCPAGERSGAC